MRGEEYSAQLDYFVRAIEEKRAADNVNSFASALMTDKVIAMIIADAEKGASTRSDVAIAEPPRVKRGFFSLGR